MSFRYEYVIAGLFCATAFAASGRGATPTMIENADGKRVLQMDDPTTGKNQLEVSVDGGHAMLYVGKDEILVDPGSPATLILDGDTVRHSAAGVIIAHFDGSDLRHGNASDGKILMNYHHPDLCPDAAANRVYRVVGPELTKSQEVAVLYALEPSLFKLTDEETAAQQKAMAAAGAEEDRLAKMDQVTKKWTVLNGHGPVDKINQGEITFAVKAGGTYPITIDYTKGGGPSFTGVALSKELSGDRYIWAAYGTPKTIALCAYKIEGGKLSGEWHPWYDMGDPKNIGTEELSGPDSLDGDFQITAAKAPATGAAYTGTVTIKPLTVVGADDDEKPYSFTWTFGATKVYGIGIRTKDMLYVASGTGADTLIAKFKMENGNSTFNGDFFKLGSADMGGLAAMN